MEPNADNRVIVRVWTSGANQEVPGVNVGHISVEMPGGGYVSLWPKRTAQGFGDVVPYQLLSNYGEDLEAENRPPELVICLYTLETAQMNREFENEKSKLTGWTLVKGSPIFSQPKQGKVHSCATLALKVLEAGGIKALAKRGNAEDSCWSLNPSDTSRQGWGATQEGAANKSTTSPESVVGLVIKAKVSEVQHYPATTGEWFLYADETPLDKVKDLAGKNMGIGGLQGKVKLVGCSLQ